MYRIFQLGGKVQITELILHCAAINTGQFNGLSAFQVRAEVDRWHQKRGFTGFGYHGLIMPDGEYRRGRPYYQMGAHCRDKNKNRGTLGFLLIESLRITRISEFRSWYTPQQMDTLRAQIAALKRQGVTNVSGHNDYANCRIPDDHISPRRSALFVARSVLMDIRDGAQTC